MSGQELFERILRSLHDAALDDVLWPAASGLIDEACESKGNFLVTARGTVETGVKIFFARFCYRGEHREHVGREYFETYYAVDEAAPRMRRLPDSQVVPQGSLYTDEEKRTSPAYNEALPRKGHQNGLTVRLDGPDGSRIAWAIADPVAGDGWSTAQVETIRCVLPHLRQFVRVRHALANARALGSTVTALLDNTRCGVIQLDLRGRIVSVNDRARALVRKGDGLGDHGGVLRAVSAEDDATLQRLLGRALPPFGVQGESGTMTITRPTVSPRLVLHVTPLGDQGMDMRPSRVAALVLVIDPTSHGRVDPAVLGSVLGLTPAESHVAVLLAQGCTVADIAAATGRRQSTIRWHVKHIFSKLNVSRQVELVPLVLSLVDFPGSRN